MVIHDLDELVLPPWVYSWSFDSINGLISLTCHWYIKRATTVVWLGQSRRLDPFSSMISRRIFIYFGGVWIRNLRHLVHCDFASTYVGRGTSTPVPPLQSALCPRDETRAARTSTSMGRGSNGAPNWSLDNKPYDGWLMISWGIILANSHSG